MLNDPLIITAKMDADSFDFLNNLRHKHFPVERNFLAAHITLFHHLPGDKLDEIEDFLKIIASRQYEFPLNFSSVRFLGRGTAIEIESAELISAARKTFKSVERVSDRTGQTKVQAANKTEPEEARRLFEEIKKNWETKCGEAVGLQLWHYRGGPWQIANELAFYKTEDH